MYSLIHDTASVALLVIACLNMVAFVSLVGEAASEYLDQGAKGDKGYYGAKLRLQMVRVLLWAVSVIVALKITLPADLADGIISAWFVGQGFALQNVTRSIIAGIVARYDSDLNAALCGQEGKKVKYQYGGRTIEKATVKACNLVTFSLQDTESSKVLVLEWTEVHFLTIL